MPRPQVELALVLTLLAALPCGQEDAPSATTDEEAEHAHGVRLPPPSPEEIAELPPDGGPEFNRLVFEKSPYLLQHARNPVDWYPWGEEAFARAAELDKPVFLSVGYSTCHWCHVMEHESFEDAEVAALMNEAFVCVKVDREERPDVDQAFMSVTQALTGRGGWPNTVVMTPDKQPFFAGTYFPKASSFGRPGMLELVPRLTEVWVDQRAEVLESAEQIIEYVDQIGAEVAGEVPGLEAFVAARDQLDSRYDAVHGGFGEAPKFPVPHQLRFLLRRWARDGDEEALEMVEHTLERMAAGGLWDHVGFGFHRYSTDARWFLPHFEKMLYDQASLALAYVEGWQATGRDDFRTTAEQVFAYVLRDMTHPEGGFYSAEDADSEGEEGLFYLWTPEELVAALGETEAELWIDAYGITAEGNFLEEASGERTGRSHCYLPRSLDALAAERELEMPALQERLEASRQTLFGLREGRIHPLKDDKVLTDWNGLMIAAFAVAGRSFDDARYREAAERAGEFVWANLRDEEGQLYKRWRQGEAAFPGMLEDYAFLAWGYLELFLTTQDALWLERATALVEALLVRFDDPDSGALYQAPADGEELFTRTKEVYDGARPSGNAVTAEVLLRLGRILARPEWERRAERLLAAYAGTLTYSPSNYAHSLLALDFALATTHEVVVVGDPAAEDTRAMLNALWRPYLPGKVVVLKPLGVEQPAIARLALYVANQSALDERATAYVCRNYACEAPTNDVRAMLALLSEGRAEGDGE